MGHGVEGTQVKRLIYTRPCFGCLLFVRKVNFLALKNNSEVNAVLYSVLYVRSWLKYFFVKLTRLYPFIFH